MREKIQCIAQFKRSVATLLLLIFASYYANITLFTHYHVIDGVTIAHSHIYSADHTESDSEQHTKLELTLIHAISNFVAECQDSVAFVVAITLVSVCIYSQVTTRIVPINIYAHPQLRAPPAELLIG